MSAELHISSLVAYHRESAEAALDAVLAGLPQVELVARQDGRSVLLCESADERELMIWIEAMQDIDGVVGVSLVYHHAESRHTLLQEDPA